MRHTSFVWVSIILVTLAPHYDYSTKICKQVTLRTNSLMTYVYHQLVLTTANFYLIKSMLGVRHILINMIYRYVRPGVTWNKT